MADELPIFTKWVEFLNWLLPTTEKLPKKVRFTLTQRIDNLALDIVEDLVEARYSRDKQVPLGRASLRLHEEARHLARLLVSEIKLYNDAVIEEGKTAGNIYSRLKDDIDRSRQMYFAGDRSAGQVRLFLSGTGRTFGQR